MARLLSECFLDAAPPTTVYQALRVPHPTLRGVHEYRGLPAVKVGPGCIPKGF